MWPNRAAFCSLAVAVVAAASAFGAGPTSAATGPTTSRELKLFTAELAATTPAEAREEQTAEQRRLEGCVPQLVKSLAALPAVPKVSSPLGPQPPESDYAGQAVARDLGLLLVDGAGARGEGWNTRAILTLYRATELVPSAKARIPASFVAREVKPLESLDFCAVYRRWVDRGLTVAHAPTSILNVAEKGALSTDGALGTTTAAAVRSWGASPGLTRVWLSEVRAGLSREAALFGDVDPGWKTWLTSVGLTAQFKREDITATV